MTDKLDSTRNPARVLAEIAQARGEPIDPARVERLAAHCEELVSLPPRPFLHAQATFIVAVFLPA